MKDEAGDDAFGRVQREAASTNARRAFLKMVSDFVPINDEPCLVLPFPDTVMGTHEIGQFCFDRITAEL